MFLISIKTNFQWSVVYSTHWPAASCSIHSSCCRQSQSGQKRRSHWKKRRKEAVTQFKNKYWPKTIRCTACCTCGIQSTEPSWCLLGNKRGWLLSVSSLPPPSEISPSHLSEGKHTNTGMHVCHKHCSAGKALCDWMMLQHWSCRKQGCCSGWTRVSCSLSWTESGVRRLLWWVMGFFQHHSWEQKMLWAKSTSSSQNLHKLPLMVL